MADNARAKRLADLIREVVAEKLQRGIKDPRLGTRVTITLPEQLAWSEDVQITVLFERRRASLRAMFNAVTRSFVAAMVRLSAVKLRKPGTAMATRMPRIAIAVISSISVMPWERVFMAAIFATRRRASKPD